MRPVIGQHSPIDTLQKLGSTEKLRSRQAELVQLLQVRQEQRNYVCSAACRQKMDTCFLCKLVCSNLYISSYVCLLRPFRAIQCTEHIQRLECRNIGSYRLSTWHQGYHTTTGLIDVVPRTRIYPLRPSLS